MYRPGTMSYPKPFADPLGRSPASALEFSGFTLKTLHTCVKRDSSYQIIALVNVNKETRDEKFKMRIVYC